MSELHIGARGWRFPHWVGEFYPEDLPRDWWLSYYSNEFDSVLVPADYWDMATPDTVATWVEGCSDEFMFFVEVPASAAGCQLQPLLQAFGRQLGGLVIKAPRFRDDASHLLKLINELSRYARVCIEPSLTQRLSTQDRQIIQSRCAGPYWQVTSGQVNSDGIDMIGADFLIGCFESSITLNPMAMRELIEGCLAAKQNLAPGLFFCGSKPKLENIRTAGVISQLIG